MDYHLVDQAPRGSALSAYGMARGFRWNLPLLALVAGSLVLAVGGMAWLLSRPVLIPRYPLLIVTARPALLHAALSPEERATLPRAWGRIVATKSHLPAIFAVALDEDGAPHTFAALPGQASGDDRVPTDTVPHWSLPGFWHAFRTDAAFALRGDLFTAWVLRVPLEEDPRTVVTGTWKEGVGRLTTDPSDAATRSDLVGQLIAALGDDLTAREAIFTGLLSQGVDLRGMSQAPSATSLAVSELGNRTLTLRWAAPLSEQDRAQVAAMGGSISAQGDQAIFYDAATTTADIAPPPVAHTCPGSLRFALEGTVLRHALETVHAPPFLQERFSSLIVTHDGSDAFVCLY